MPLFSSKEKVGVGLSSVGVFDFFFFFEKIRSILPPESPLDLPSSFSAMVASSKSAGLSQVVCSEYLI